jgi:short-subunit dehydrogenase
MNILVTGANKGIGFEICSELVKKSEHQVFGLARNISQLEKLSAHYANVTPILFDLEKDVFERLAELIPDKIDVLINNAGFLINKPFAEICKADIEKTFTVNFSAPFTLIQTLLPRFSNNAHVLNISSMGGFQGSAKFPGLSVYSSSKAALACLTECLAEELKDLNIKSNCLCLGAVQTEMLNEAFPGYQAPVNASEMAKFIVDFALHAHQYINGKVIPVSLSTP